MTLKAWNDISNDFKDAIIIGNGASIAICEDFSISSLWETAVDKKLIGTDLVDVADKLETGVNIELLLRQLWTAEVVNEKLNIKAANIEDAYNELRGALIQTVSEIHCAHAGVTAEIQSASAFLRQFKTVFSLNYDLLTYWAMMASNEEQEEHQYKDCFIRGSFDDDWEKYREPNNQKKSCTLVFYPHGALQFVQERQGIERKLDSTNSSGDLLKHVLDSWEDPSLLPLFVTEGDSAKKMRSIQRSSYLSNVYYEALPYSGPTLVIYGWSMNKKFDGHLLKQIKNGNYDKLAVSVHQSSTEDVELHIQQIKNQLRGIGVNDVVFFDAESEGCWIHQSKTKGLTRHD